MNLPWIFSFKVIWKSLYCQTSRDHGTLGYFRSKLNRTPVTKDPEKDVNTSLDFMLTVVKGHLLAAACKILGATSFDSPLQLPQDIKNKSTEEQLSFLSSISAEVVEKCTLLDKAFTREVVEETNDGVYNYARVL